MTKDANQNDPSIRIAIGARTGSTKITEITMIPRKKSRRRRNTGAITGIVKVAVIMTTTDRRTSVVASMGLAANNDSIRTNDNTTKVRKMIDTRNCAGTNHTHLAIIDV